MIYLDSSALIKLVAEEPQSPALEVWIGERLPVDLVSSRLAQVEVMRGVRRIDAELLPSAAQLLARVGLLSLDARQVLDLASTVGSPHLRSLDAIHLASALILGDALDAFVGYDRRLLDAAADLGLPVVSPASRVGGRGARRPPSRPARTRGLR
ncbi:MAG: type II toxin-antitoxin system VapC family toxin [Micrococcales bacterium]|nr:type II toxin-antitoxin system VapC family toxin [Micrococcales bacterium]